MHQKSSKPEARHRAKNLPWIQRQINKGKKKYDSVVKALSKISPNEKFDGEVPPGSVI